MKTADANRTCNILIRLSVLGKTSSFINRWTVEFATSALRANTLRLRRGPVLSFIHARTSFCNSAVAWMRMVASECFLWIFVFWVQQVIGDSYGQPLWIAHEYTITISICWFFPSSGKNSKRCRKDRYMKYIPISVARRSCYASYE